MQLIVTDTETTGLESAGSRLVEIAAQRCDGKEVINTFESLINPGMPIPPDATTIHGITDDMVRDAPDAGTVLRRFFEWIGDDRLIMGHCIGYDVGVISWDAGRFGISIPEGLYTICTLEIARAIKATKKNNLNALVEHYQITRAGEAHRAMADVDACRQYFDRVKDLQPLSPTPWEYAGHDYHYCDPPFGMDELVKTRTPLSFAYVDAKGKETERSIVPYGWAQKNDGVYFHGWCHLREKRRTFRTDRVTLLETV